MKRFLARRSPVPSNRQTTEPGTPAMPDARRQDAGSVETLTHACDCSLRDDPRYATCAPMLHASICSFREWYTQITRDTIVGGGSDGGHIAPAHDEHRVLELVEITNKQTAQLAEIRALFFKYCDREIDEIAFTWTVGAIVA